SKQVYKQILKKKIDLILLNAGFEFRLPGCSACLGMNEDKIPSGEYCLSTSNRNFEGRQGKGARTLLASPLVAAITALEGKIVNISEYLKYNPIN
ncbi:MAG: aconitase family protein, partial [Candidatus Karelsulcia muelleri]